MKASFRAIKLVPAYLKEKMGGKKGKKSGDDGKKEAEKAKLQRQEMVEGRMMSGGR